MTIKLIKTVALTGAIALSATLATTGVADAHRYCRHHYGWHYGWHKGWHSHHRTYAHSYRPAHYGMSTPATYGYSGYGYTPYRSGGLFGGPGLLGLGTGII